MFFEVELGLRINEGPLSPGFYLTFWQLSMYDLSPPAARYDEEGAALRTLSRQEDAKYISADRSSDRSKRLTASSHRAKRDRCNAFVNTLAQEFKEQTASRVFTLKRLAREKQHWFAHGEFASSSNASNLCIIKSRTVMQFWHPPLLNTAFNHAVCYHLWTRTIAHK